MTHDITLRKRRCILGCVVLLGVSMVAPTMAQTTGDKDKRKTSDLSERLIRGATKSPDEDVMASIVRLMGKASEKLAIQLDPGTETQEIQRQIAAKLDEAIKTAAAQRRSTRQRQKSSRSDKRRRSGKKKKTAAKQKSSGSESSKSEADGQTTAGGPSSAGTTGGELHERRRMWGNLPERDREEVLQGIGEQHLEQYKEWIERYYRALQEAEEKR